MKKMLVLLTLVSYFTFGASFDVKESKELTEKQKFEFEMEKKSPWAAVGISWLVPSAGHAYAGKWGRGLGFLAGEVLALGLMINADSDNVYHSGYTSGSYYTGYTYNPSYVTGTENDWLISAGLITFVGLRVWEYFDAYKTTKEYNYNLYRKLSFEPTISLENKSVGLQASYKF